MIDIEEILRTDAAGWQRYVDAGARPRIEPAPEPRPRRIRGPWVPIVAAVVIVLGLTVGLVVTRGSGAQHPAGHSAAPAASTASSPPVATSALRGVTWTDPVSSSTVVFEQDVVRISDGCDHSLYALVARENMFVIGKPVGPLSVCGGQVEPPPGPLRRAYEAHQAAVMRFYRIMNARPSWVRDVDTLTLTDAAGTLFLRTNGTSDPELAGSTWVLHRVVDRGNELSGSFTAATLHISQNGVVTAGLLCGHGLEAQAQISDTTVTFTDEQASSGPHCANRNAEESLAVMDSVLSGQATYAINDTNLFVYGRDSSLLIYEVRR